MRSKFLAIVVLTGLSICNTSLAAPKDDIATLRSYQQTMSDFTSDFLALSTRLEQSRDATSSNVAITLGDVALQTTLQLELLKDVIVGIGLLRCDRDSQEYFRQVARERTGDTGVVAFLDLKARDISTLTSLTQDARIVTQANRLRETLRSIRDSVLSMRTKYI